ncbi:MAG: methylenetetrahydrofolate reductase [NAD(P)H] [Cyclobacteriaceae bacterium]
MKITEHISTAQSKKKTLFSFEVLPPKKGEHMDNLINAIDPLMEFEPAFIDVTYHREEYVYRKLPDGTTKKVTTKKRPGTVGICAALQNKYKIDAVPHIICGGFSKEETENALIDLNFLGIDNVLALRGDQIKSESSFVPEPDGNAYATDLIEQVQQMNIGKYLDDELDNSTKTDFCIGAACYPEKHFEAESLDSDMKYLKQKIELGAEYLITQMFFDNQKFFDFVKQCRAEGITVPIIPGLKPLATVKQLDILPSIFFIDMPEELRSNVLAASSKEEVKEIGIQWSIQQCKELIDFGSPVLHFYTMSKSTATQKIARAVF